jgi:glycosyltransferase involved in cell wall biosynthesis
MSRIVLDVRCLQDRSYARRGVGRHALALLRGAPPGTQLVGLVDPALEPIIDEARELLYELHTNGQSALLKAQPPAAFVALSPMTHTPLFAARLLSDARLLRVAVVYDFIPKREPKRYLRNPADRLAYANALAWLSRYDLFMPISSSTAHELPAMLGVPHADIEVTGAPAGQHFEAAQDMRRRLTANHLLVVGGGDPRKNPEIVVRAHALSSLLQQASIPLVVLGNYGPAEANALRNLSATLGGRPELVKVPGHVSESELVGFYARALAIVTPSYDEGFSLPVVEGMAAGAPSLASDIPAHRELVQEAALRFAPDDYTTLLPLLERAATDPAWRSKVVASQADIWPRFRADRVAERFWSALTRRLSSQPISPSVMRGARPRVALLSPLPPDRSGVADYTAATCTAFGRHVELHVFTETERPAPIPGVARVAPLGSPPCLLPEYDRVIHVIGNSHFHLRIFELLRRYGGACIAHDARMLSFYRFDLGMEHAKAVAGRELGRAVSADEINMWLAEEGKLEALFLGEIAESAGPTIVHSLTTARLIEERHGVRPKHIPFSIYRPWTVHELGPAARAAARVRLGLQPREVAIATFGYVHSTKGPEECVQALNILRGWRVPASLHFVGGTEAMPDRGAALRSLIASLGLTAEVRFAETFVSEQTYKDYLLGADLGVQLRTYGLGGLSGALLDCAAAGLPTVTNSSLGAAVGVPQSYVRDIPDALSPLRLAQALADLLHAGPSQECLEADRSAYSEERSFAAYARELCAALDLDPKL